jgi:hypothetical protein
MPALVNARHERFAQEVAKGNSHGQSYEVCGYSCRSHNSRDAAAFRLFRNCKIRRRIAELQKYAVENTDITIVGLIREAADLQLAAQRAGNLSAAIAALTAKAKLAGLWVEKTESENTNLNYAISDQLPTEEQWEAERVKQQAIPASVARPSASR